VDSAVALSAKKEATSASRKLIPYRQSLSVNANSHTVTITIAATAWGSCWVQKTFD